MVAYGLDELRHLIADRDGGDVGGDEGVNEAREGEDLGATQPADGEDDESAALDVADGPRAGGESAGPGEGSMQVMVAVEDPCARRQREPQRIGDGDGRSSGGLSDNVHTRRYQVSCRLTRSATVECSDASELSAERA